jgi:hypothetical protein
VPLMLTSSRPPRLTRLHKTRDQLRRNE